MNNQEVTVYNVADQIREKVKYFMMQAIPAEQFDAMIKKEWDSFFVSPSPRNNWEQPLPSPFSQIVKEALQKYMQVKIDESIKIELERWVADKNTNWSQTGQKIVGNVVKGYAPEFLRSMSEQATADAIQKFAQQRNIPGAY